MIDLETLINLLDLDRAAFQKGALGVAGEARSDALMPEHLLAGLLHIPGGYTVRRVKKLRVKPLNMVEVLKAGVENEANDKSKIGSFENAPVSKETTALLRKLTDWLKTREHPDAPVSEQDFLSLVLTELSRDTVDDLMNFAQIDWEEFIRHLEWPPREAAAILLWHPKTGALQEKSALDKSGRRLISALEAELKGLGLQEYTVEALFVTLLNIEPSIMDQALRTQFISKEAYVANSRDLAMDLRNRIRKPRPVSDVAELSRANCHPRLAAVLEAAAEIASHDGKQKMSVRDICEGMIRKEAASVLGNILKQFRIDLESASQFLETYIEVEEADDTMIPIGELEEAIKRRIIGQDHAVVRILPLVKRLRFGYRRPGKPAGVFLFMGPSGTGKTQMAKTLAKILYGSEDNMIMLEMGQFGTEHSKSMFIGAPPGYVGYGEGKLTNGIRDNPESVVLFDEVEKAHPSVLDVLLRFLDEGKIDDPAGPVRDGSKCLIVLTSNFMANDFHEFEEAFNSPDPDIREKAYRELRDKLLEVGSNAKGGNSSVDKFFRPEFIFRIDEIILYRSFDRDDYRKIAELSLGSEIEHFKSQYDYDLDYDEELLDLIAQESYKRSNEGARVINRVVNVCVVNPLIDFLTNNAGKDFEKIHLAVNKKTKEIKVVTK